jgi:hypothetical protein
MDRLNPNALAIHLRANALKSSKVTLPARGAAFKSMHFEVYEYRYNPSQLPEFHQKNA